jgi:preprotein translocase SecE subunit
MALELYKQNEATRTRGLIAILLALLLGYGLVQLHDFLAVGFWKDDLASNLLGDDFPLSPRVIIVAVLGILAAVSIYVLCNHPRVVDFLIDTEKEMQNVSWAPRHEVISSSIVVVITVVVLALYLGLVDYALVMAKDRVPWDSFWDKVLGS